MKKPVCFSLIFFAVLLSGCDFYKIFRENKQIAAFLNQTLNVWVAEEAVILEKYNALIDAEQFSSETMYRDLETVIIPGTLKLREHVAHSPLDKKEFMEIQLLFIDKIDLMLEAFDMLREGLVQKDSSEDSSILIFKGRDLLKNAEAYNRKIENRVNEMLSNYYVKAKDHAAK